jgi:sterol desaturase/sphingolipid hydroxylase (fatty acid hydroxylase superfamily)
MVSTIWHNIDSPLAYALPVFFLFVGIEAAALKFLDHDENFTGYRGVDTRTSLLMGIVGLGILLVVKFATLLLFVVMSQYLAPWHIPTDTWWGWVLLFVAVDLVFYCHHRFSHRVRIGWAAHQAHHSSEYFNLGTGGRQKWNPWVEAIFWSSLPLMGFAPWAIYVALGFNLIYQFFIHTETIGSLGRGFEYVFNTPSHHRVHHGSDPEYLDKNYGGTLIIWDRLFGTYQDELHRPTYGLTTPVNTYNLVRLQYHEYVSILRDVRGATGLRARLGYVFGPPGWQPVSHTTAAPASQSAAGVDPASQCAQCRFEYDEALVPTSSAPGPSLMP